MNPVADPTDRDGRVDAALAEYLRAGGTPFDVSAWLDRYPDVADDLAEFLEDQNAFEGAASLLVAAATPEAQTTPRVTEDDRTLTYADGDVTTDQSVLPPGSRFGDYELLDEIARGGMGVVYKARQLSLNRPVALKMIGPDRVEGRSERERFLREAEAAAALDHPNIVPIYDVGQAEGRSYFTMKLVEGGSLAVQASPRTSVRGSVELLVKVARAVHYAHQRGILHRDLKPSNILLGPGSEPLVADFGLAKRLDGPADVSKSGVIVGTPAYMAPEQARGQKGLTTAVDVYGLGAVLYELMTGRPPFRAASAAETLVLVLAGDAVQPRSLNPTVPADLEAICLKCLAREPASRYGSAEALAEDLEHWLKGEPITARPATVRERAVKWVRRNPLGTALAGSTALLVVVAVGGGVSLAYSESLAARNRELDSSRQDAETQRKEADTQRAQAEKQEAEARRRLYTARMHLANRAFQSGNIAGAIELLSPYRDAEPGQRDLRGFEWHYLWKMCRGDLWTVRAHEGGINAVAYSSDGNWVATAGEDGRVKVWDARTGREVWSLGPASGRATGVDFVPGTTHLAATLNNMDGSSVYIWDAADGGLVRRFELPTPARHLAMNPDGKHVAVAGDDGVTRVLEIAIGKTVFSRPGKGVPVSCVAFSLDGKRLASGDMKGWVNAWDWVGGHELTQFDQGGPRNRGPIRDLEFGPTGWTLLVAQAPNPGTDDPSRLIEYAQFPSPLVPGWRAGWSIHPTLLRDSFRQARFLPGGDTVVCVSDGGAVEIARRSARPTDTRMRRFCGHTGSVVAVAIGPGGRSIATAGSTRNHNSVIGELRMWDNSVYRDPITMPGIPRDHHATLSPDGHKVAFAVEENKSNTIRVAAAATGHELYRIAMVGNFCYHALFSPDEKWLATAEGEATRVFRADSGAPYATFHERPGNFGGLRLGFSPDSKLLASCSGHGLVYVYDVDSRRLIQKLELAPESAQIGGAGWVCSAAFSPDGERLVTCSEDGAVRVFRLASGACELVVAGSPGLTYTAVFSPDGASIATSGEDGAVTIWDAITGHRRLTLTGHDRMVHTCCYTADGARMLTASIDGSVRLWDTESGQELLTLHPFDELGRASIQTAAISSDGGRIVVNSRGLVRIIDVPTGDPAIGLTTAHVVYGLFHKSQSRAEVVARLMADPTLPESVRTAAIQLAGTYPLKVPDEDRESLDEILPPAEATPAQLEMALARAEQDLRDRPTDFMGQLIRGVAQFRCGAIDKATLTLESMEWPLDRGLPGPEEGIRLAFLAASLRKQGKENEAADVFSDLARGLKDHPFWNECAAFKRAYQEAMNTPMPKKP